MMRSPLRPLVGALLPLAAALLLAAPEPVRACPPQLALDELPATPNNIESGLGVTNSNAAIGSGRLTATLSRCGELTSVKWPGPSYYDQLDYLTSNAPDARALPHFGALPSMGAFAGLWVEEADGSSRLLWLRDAEWEGSQRYTASTSNVVENEYVHDALGLRVRVHTFVLPERDVLVQSFRVRRSPGSPVERARLIAYENLAPTKQRMPWIPLADLALDYDNDFAALYDAEAEAVLHFAAGPRRRFDLVNPLLQAPPADPAAFQDAVQALSESLTAEGVYLAMGFRGGSDGHQIGFDDAATCAHQSDLVERAAGEMGFPPQFVDLAKTLFSCERQLGQEPLDACRAANGWTWQAESAYRDPQDGVLDGSPLAACRVNAALARDLRFVEGEAEATLYLGAGATRGEALGLLEKARTRMTPEHQRLATEAWWAEWLAPAILPDTDDPEILRFARRALISLRTATDEASGAMLASVAAQPPYGLDWPRDGAFFNHALDRAGYHDLVTRHNRFYTRVQRKDWEPWSLIYPNNCPNDPAARSYPDCVPPGTFEMNYYADPDEAVPGGPISFEIDNTGLIVWTLYDHARFLEDPQERADYLGEVCPAMELATRTLADCRDPETGLQCFASEDDNYELTQRLQGAETVYLALRTSVQAAADCGFDPAQVSAWEDRAAELRDAAFAHFTQTDPVPHLAGPRRPWALWPTGLIEPQDPIALSHAQLLRENSIEPLLDRQTLRAGYHAEAISARARLLRARGELGALVSLEDEVRFLIRELTTPDTGHMGEFAGRVDRDLDGDGVAPDYLPENDVPHVWQQINVYLAAMNVFGAAEEPAPRLCDVDESGVVDRIDLETLAAQEGAGASGILDPRDPNEDGVISEADAWSCFHQCDGAFCFSEAAPPPACGLLGIEGLALLAGGVALRRRRRRRGPAGAPRSG